MAKKKKTREQKILADHRHLQYHLEAPLKKEPVQKPQLPQAVTVPLESFGYVTKDISRTAMVTGFILASQLILFVLLSRI